MKLRPLLLTVAGLFIGINWWIASHILVNPKLFIEQMQLVEIYAQKTPTLNPWKWIAAESSRYVSFFWRGAYHRNMFLAVLFITAIIFNLKRGRSLIVLIIAGMFGLLVGSPNKCAWYLVFVYPFLAMAVGSFIVDGGKAGRLAGFLLVAFVAAEMSERVKFYRSNYPAYIHKIEQIIPPGSVVFGSDNLWLGLHDRYRFVPENLLGWQHVFQAHKRAGDYYAGSVEDFLRRQGVQYVIADDELTAWPNFQNTLRPFLRDQCEYLAVFFDDYYSFSNYLSRKSRNPLMTGIFVVKEKK